MIRCVSMYVACWCVCLWLMADVHGQQADRKWDHEKARQMVQGLLATENKGQVWDKIRWSTNIDQVVKRAHAQNKPIFVFWYISKGGPATAPC